LHQCRTIPLQEALCIARQITEALEAAHEKGIIHRDLKPANIKVTLAGTVKVLDFGLAKAVAVESLTGLSQVPSGSEDGLMVGTPTYMSPEQARGQPSTKQTDIWAFGCVLYEMLTGRPAFHGESIGEVIAEILKSEPDWNLLPADVPPQIRTLLRRCLQKETERRLEDVGDARIEINEAIIDVQFIRKAQEPNQSAAVIEDIKPAGRRLWAIAAFACLVVVLAGVGWWRSWSQHAPISIAVLPLINMNQDPAYDYFADGLTGELIRNLSIIDGLTVRSETSSFAFKGKPQKARDIGRELEADYLLEGSVLRSGQQLRINVQLVRASDDFPVWSGRYNQELTDVFAIQDEISLAVVNNLRLKLGQGRRRYETSTEAYDLYLRARAIQRETAGDPGPRMPFFEQAIAKDPSFAPAYAGLAVAHLTLSGQARNDAMNEVAKMRVAAEKAIQLDPLSAESYDALGAAYAREAQWDQSEKSFRRSMELQPGRQESHGYFAMYYLLPFGRLDEAIRQLQIAEKSEPVFTFFLGDVLADVGRNDEAAVVCNKLPPDLKNQCIPSLMARQGKAAEVIQTYGALPDNPAWIRSALGCAYARADRRDEAERVAASFHFPGAGAPYGTALFACLGDKDRTFEFLDHVAGLGPIRTAWFLLRADREHPGLLSGDPRLTALRKKVGLPE
jgi:serine/threonine-protein kinase